MIKNKILAIIPARAGSKRIPNKNIKNFLGKPLISFTIKQALSCDLIDRVIVDTDSPKIAKIALRFGAEVLWLRPERLASDKSKVVDSILCNLRRLKNKENYQPNYVIILQTTSPLREKKDIEDCWLVMKKTKASTVLSVSQTHPKLYNLGVGNKLILVNGSEKKSNNMQAWRQGYAVTGCMYIINTLALLKEKLIITKNTKAVVCPSWRSVDLDTFEDWALAECLYKNRKRITNRIKQLYEKN